MIDMASDRYKRGPVDRPHFEMTVQDYLDLKSGKKLSKWLTPAIKTHPRPVPPTPSDDAEVRAHWEMLVAEAVAAKLKKK